MLYGPADIPSRRNENRSAWKTGQQGGGADPSGRTPFNLHGRRDCLHNGLSFDHRKTGIGPEPVHWKYVPIIQRIFHIRFFPINPCYFNHLRYCRKAVVGEWLWCLRFVVNSQGTGFGLASVGQNAKAEKSVG